MPSLEEYIFLMEALDEELTASGLVVFGCQAAGSGTCGVNGLADLPVITGEGTADWVPLGLASLPAPTAMGTTLGWLPARGEEVLPALAATGQAVVASKAGMALPPFFALARGGMRGEALFPTCRVDAISEIDRTGTAGCTLPPPTPLGYGCGLESPVTTGVGSAAVVNLLCQGDPELATLAVAFEDFAGNGDALAGVILAAVATRIAYTDDADTDVWTCALGTYFRGIGDCEDGAILLHALLLAAGVPADRLVTAFGRVGLDREGHAWVGYRRLSDGQWVALDWTRGPNQGVVANLPVLGEAAYYAVVDYALTAGSFFTVRQDAAVFFARATADRISLPAMDVAAEGTPGAKAGIILPAGLVTCAGRAGILGACRLGNPTLAGTAGSVNAACSTPMLSLLGNCGAGATLAPHPPRVTAQAGGGGKAATRFPRLQGLGVAETTAVGGGALSLTTWRVFGSGLTGWRGAASCTLPRPRVRANGLPGSLAQVGASLSTPACTGTGGERARGAAMITAMALGARGQARFDEFIPDTSPFDAAVGEEW